MSPELRIHIENCAVEEVAALLKSILPGGHKPPPSHADIDELVELVGRRRVSRRALRAAGFKPVGGGYWTHRPTNGSDEQSAMLDLDSIADEIGEAMRDIDPTGELRE